MKAKAIVFINEQHRLLDEQHQLLDENFGDWDTCSIPSTGWTLDQQKEVSQRYFKSPHAGGLGYDAAVFASPVPWLLSRLSFAAGAWSWGESINHSADELLCGVVYVFHNDRRVAKELPNGKVVHTIAPTGWQLV